MEATNRIEKKVKSSTTVQIIANVSLRAITSSSSAPISHNNNSFSRLSNLI